MVGFFHTKTSRTCCISFVSPDKVLEKKEKFMYHHYLQWRIQQYTKNFDEMMAEIVDHCEDNTVEISKVVRILHCL